MDKRSRQLDILRAIAVLLVMGRHMEPCSEGAGAFLHSLTYLWWEGGWAGVDLFFVISGFLVSGLLFREWSKKGTIDAARFFIRRGFKIYPAFWLLIGTLLVVNLFQGRVLPLKSIFAELLFFQNYIPGIQLHTWSIGVEEHFYLLLGLSLAFLSARGTRGPNPFRVVPIAFVCIALLCLGMRLVTAQGSRYEIYVHHFPTHLRLDSLSFGVLLSYFAHRDPVRFKAFSVRYRYALLLAGVALFSPAFLLPIGSGQFPHTFGFTMFYLGSGCLLVGILGIQIPGGRITEAIAGAGANSYSIYLWHMPVLAWIVPAVAGLCGKYWNWPLYFVTYFGGALFVGLFAARLIERPFLHLRDRLFPSSSNGSLPDLPKSRLVAAARGRSAEAGSEIGLSA